MSIKVIENATIITMGTHGTIGEGHIIIEDNRIKSVQNGNCAEDLKDEANQVIDAKSGYVMPGFINTHTHAAMSLFRSYADDLALMDWLQNKIWPIEAKLTGEDVYYGTALSIVEMIRNGVTTFADMYFFMEEVAKAVEQSGVRASLSRGMIGLKGDDSLSEAKHFIENWHNQADNRITCMVAPHAPYTCPPEFLQKAVSLSASLDVPIHIHVSETRGEVKQSWDEYVKSPVKHLLDEGLFERPTLAAHCVHVDDSDIAILKDKSVKVSHNPGSNLKLGSGIAPIDQMLSQGITVSLGTDGPSSNNNIDLLEEARIASLIQKGVHEDPTLINAKTALNLATTQGGESLFIPDVGKIEPGYKADIIIIDSQSPELYPKHDPVGNIVYSCNPNNITHTMVDGEFLLVNGEFLRTDEELIYYHANECAKRLTR